MLSLTDVLWVAGFFVNLVAAFIIVRWIYSPRQSEPAYLFTFIAFNTVIYFIMGLFTSVELSIGVGFGLFALFSILRYRTETVPIREMTYLFVMVALPVLNSIFFGTAQYGKMLISNVLIILVLWILEQGWGFRTGQSSKEVVYERIDLVHAARREEMIEDLKKRTGLNVTKVEITRINFLKDTAKLRIHYSESTDAGE